MENKEEVFCNGRKYEYLVRRWKKIPTSLIKKMDIMDVLSGYTNQSKQLDNCFKSISLDELETIYPNLCDLTQLDCFNLGRDFQYLLFSGKCFFKNVINMTRKEITIKADHIRKMHYNNK